MSLERLSRRALLRAGAVSAAGVVVAACQPKVVEVEKVVKETVEVEKVIRETVEVEKEIEKVVKETVVVPQKEAIAVQIWHGFSSAPSAPALTALVDTWNETNPDQQVKETVVPGTQQQQIQKAAAAVAAGIPPDVWATTIPMVYGMRGMVIPLTAYADIKGNWDPEDWFPFVVFRNTNPNTGDVFGLCMHSDSRGLFWRKDAFREVGLDPEKPPTTWSELREFSQKLTKKSGNLYERIGFIPGYAQGYIWTYIGLANGWPLIDWAQVPAAVRWNTPEAVKALTFMRDLTDDAGGKAATNTFAEGFQTGADQPFLSGQLPMMVNGSWNVATFRNLAPDLDYGVTHEPIADDGGRKATLSAGWSWAVPLGAKYPKEAYDVISFLVDDEQMRTWTVATGNMPPKRSVAALPDFQQGKTAFFSEAMSWNGTFPVGPWQGDPLRAMYTAVDEVLLHIKEVQPALDGVNEETQRLVNEYFATL